jgi:hypothetical protein
MTNTQIQLFATVGVSTKNCDTTKFRFTNRGAEAYGDILVKEGHTSVQFIDLTDPLSKADAIAEFVKQFPDYAELKVPGLKAEKTLRAPKAPRAAKEPKEPKAAGARKTKTVTLTAEQVAAAKAAAKRATDAARKRASRAASKATDVADANLDAALAALDAATAETTEA